MIFNSPLRKNYLLNNDTSVITQKRQESDSNSRSLSRSCDSIKKSPNNSFQKIRKQQIRKKQETINKLNQRTNIMARSNVITQIKQRSQSINTMYNYLGSLHDKKNQQNSKPKTNEGFGYDSIVLKRNSKNIQHMFKQPVKLSKYQSQNSEISTQEPPSIINNFIGEDQRPGFVRFSECMVDTPGSNNKKQRSAQKGSLSILKNRKNAISCSKIDSSYLKFRDKNVNQKEKVFDTMKTRTKQIVQNLRQRFYQRVGKRQYSYFDLYEQQKYKDDLFPASIHSLFFSKSKLDELKQKIIENGQYQFVDIVWKRISDIFPATSKLTIYKEKSSQKIIKNYFSLASNDFCLSLNAIKNVSQYFGKVFQSPNDKYEKHGVYCLKIYQQNGWKSVIIDDYIPLMSIKNKKTQQLVNKPLFVDVEVNGQEIQIWPFLLEKAYASYYNNYEAINQGFKLIDWLEEILMAPSQCYYFPDNQQLSEQAVKKLQKNIYQFPSSESIIIGINIKTKQPCIIQKRHSQASQQVLIKTLKSQRKMKTKHIFEIIHTFYLFLPFHFKYFNTCPINFNKGKKPVIKQHPMAKIKYRDQIFVRTFAVDEEGPFSLTVRQKQKRFYQRNLKKYEYLWNRVILVMKEFDNGYRWIDGKYSNEKSINFNLYLQKGEYEIMIMPQVSSEESMHDLTLIALSNKQIGIERKLYEEKQHLLEVACCDIAQRKGTFKQLNDYICSYSLIEKSSGIIIENVNNQKSNGQICITRSVAGLKAKVQIYPFNLQFCINEHQINIHKRKYKKNVQILVEKNNHFTVVLMMKGGIDEKFLKVFKFGN